MDGSITRVEMMKIELNAPTLDGVTSAKANRPETGGGQDVQGPEEDKATLSASQANVQALVAKALSSPEIRQDKVEALRQAIGKGEYKVDPGEIADAMIQESQ